MKTLATWKTSLLVTALFVSVAGAAPEFEGVEGPNVRFMRHEDGGRAVFIQSPDKKTITRKTFSANGVLTMVTTYKMDANGNPTGCKIRDGKDVELFKVAYGYDRNTGNLVSELMFDSRTKRIDPKSGKETPVQRVVYLYDADGKRSAPITYNYFGEKTFEEVFGIKSSAMEVNPFKEGRR